MCCFTRRPFSDSLLCVWGILVLERKIHLSGPALFLGMSESLENQHRHVLPLLTIYRISRRTRYNSTQYARHHRPFVPLLYISAVYKYKYHQTTTLLYHHLVFKSPSHARRPCAPTHLCRGPRTSHNPLPTALQNSLHPPLPVVAPLAFLVVDDYI
jgi:hypothetical protein